MWVWLHIPLLQNHMYVHLLSNLPRAVLQSYLRGCIWRVCSSVCPQTKLKLTALSSVQFSHLVVSDPLQPHGLQYARLPCPSPTSRVYLNSCPLSWWCHPTISSCHPLLLPPSIFPSIRVFSSWVSSLNQVAKVLEFQL